MAYEEEKMIKEYTCNKRINGADFKTKIEFSYGWNQNPDVSITIMHEINNDFVIDADVTFNITSEGLCVSYIYIRLCYREESKNVADYIREYCSVLKIHINYDNPSEYKVSKLFGETDSKIINECYQSDMDDAKREVFKKMFNVDNDFINDYCYMVKNIWYKSLGL